MENSTAAMAVPVEHCASCSVSVTDDDVYCPNCGYPLKGAEKDQRYFMSEREAQYIDMVAFNKKIKTAGNSLYYLSAIFALGAIISFVRKQDDPDVLAYVLPLLILVVLFLVLGAFSRKKPLVCIVSGLALYIIVQVLLFIDNPVNIFSGIIFKIFIIGYLINGIKSAIEIEKFKKEHNIG